MIPPQLALDVEVLRQCGYAIDVTEEGTRHYVIIKSFQMNSAYSPTTTDLMMMADYQYPQSRMDMYWTDPEVRCGTGAPPMNADQFEIHLGRRWQRWSWHYPLWQPGKHNLITHLEVFLDRLARGC